MVIPEACEGVQFRERAHGICASPRRDETSAFSPPRETDCNQAEVAYLLVTKVTHSKDLVPVDARQRGRIGGRTEGPSVRESVYERIMQSFVYTTIAYSNTIMGLLAVRFRLFQKVHIFSWRSLVFDYICVSLSLLHGEVKEG
jgi:hypothetical protein